MRLPKLPKLLERKIYKTGQTRGADDDEIYQNRVLRNSTVLIPYSQWPKCRPIDSSKKYEKGYVVLIPPATYFNTPDVDKELATHGLELGKNAIVFYEKRSDWTEYNPEDLGWSPADHRGADLGGKYVVRIPATTRKSGAKISCGYNVTKKKGAGIRVYEYANKETIGLCVVQLEGLFWSCADSVQAAIAAGMSKENAETRRKAVLKACKDKALLDVAKLQSARILNGYAKTVCPLCLAELSGVGFITKQAQAPGREVHDLTITQVNLFHIEELTFGQFGHRPYNLGWGHHHCNVVVKDAGIKETLEWMRSVLKRNHDYGGHSPDSSKET